MFVLLHVDKCRQCTFANMTRLHAVCIYLLLPYQLKCHILSLVFLNHSVSFSNGLLEKCVCDIFVASRAANEKNGC